MRLFALLAVICSLFFVSCSTPNKVVYNYLEDMKDTTSLQSFYITEPVIQKNDQLSVQISSASLDPTADQIYNSGSTSVNTTYISPLSGYLVNQKGNIELPHIGTVHAEGLTKTQLADSVKAKLQGLLTNPQVLIRFLNFRIIVIGEVGSPGVKTVNVENLNILEALAMAGDITLYGKKKEVKIIREYNGTRKLGIIDVTSKAMFQSPYYQLQQNDVVMVEQSKYKIRSIEQGRISQQVGFFLGILNSLLFLYTITRK